MAKANDVPPFLRLPAELVQYVLSFLEPPHLASVAQTCKSLSKHSYDDRIWKRLVNENFSTPITDPTPLASFRELYSGHHPYWFLPRHRIWFADTFPNGKLVVCRYEPREGSIAAYTVVAARGQHTLHRWEKDTGVIIHSFNPRIGLDLDRPVLRLTPQSVRTDDQPQNYPSDRGYAPPSKLSKEVVMEMFVESGLYSSFALCRALPRAAISDGTQVWPPLRFPATSRARNSSRDAFDSAGHRPTVLGEISENNFRLRKWVEYNGRRSSPRIMQFTSPNGLAAALGLTQTLFSTSIATNDGGGSMNIRMPEDVTTFASLPKSCYTPTPQKPWQGIWCGDYSGHGCEFIMIQQLDKEDAGPLPAGMDWLEGYFRGLSNVASEENNDGGEEAMPSGRNEVSYMETARRMVSGDDAMAPGLPTEDEDERGVEAVDDLPPPTAGSSTSPHPSSSRQLPRATTDYSDAPTGRLEAIKLTGDINIPRGEYTFIAPDIGHGGLIRIADEETFRGARVVRSAGHIAATGFEDDEYMPSQLIMVSHDTLAQFWTGFGHISYYRRVNLDALLNYGR